MFAVQPPPRTSCCLIFVAVFLLLGSLAHLGGAGFVAYKSQTLQYHYAYFVCGGLSFLTSDITFYAGQDIGRRRGGVIAASAFAIAGIIACIVAIPFAVKAIDKENRDCVLPTCKISPKFEISSEQFKIGGVQCAWECFENYKVFWQAMMYTAVACIGLQAIIVVVIFCHCLVDCCCRRKSSV